MSREYLENIKSENRLERIRLIQTNDPVIGGQPTDNGDEFTSNTPLLDLACTMKFALDEIDSNSKSANESLVKIEESLQLKVDETTNVNAGNGLTGGGDLTTSRTLALGTPSTISQNTKNSVTDSSHTHEIAKATTSQQGIVQLTNTIDTSQDKAITPFAVNELQKAIEQAITEATEVPVDKIFAFDTATPPKGYIARNGQAIDQATMPKLYARYGANMPDDRDRVLRMAGSLAGSAGSTQEDAMQNVQGVFGDVQFSHSSYFTPPFYRASEKSAGGDYGSGSSRGSYDVGFELALSARTATETRAKSRIVIFCNKIQ